MKRIVFLPIVFALLIAGCAPRLAQLPPLIPRQVLFDNPAKKDPQISPDGKRLAYLAPDVSNVLQIRLRSLTGRDDRQLTAEEKRGIQHYTWAYDNRHLVFARESDGDENWQIQVVDSETGDVRNMTPYKGVRSLLVGMAPSEPRSLLVAMNLRNRRFFDVYRIDLDTGETRMVNRNGGRQFWWVADHQLNVRIAAAFAGTIFRENRGRPWRTVRKWQVAEQGQYLGFSNDEQTFYVSGTDNDDNGALLAIDLASGAQTPIVSDPKHDVETAFIHPISGEIQAVGFYGDKLEWRVLDPNIADDFSFLADLRPGEFRVVHPPYESPIIFSSGLGRRDLADTTWIVSYESDDGPIHHYAYDRATKTARFLFSEQPKLDALTLAKMQPISYQSRDHLQINGYLTLPVGMLARHLPTVLYVHGGPWLRDRWGYHNTAQWLANRGYAVLQVNYRGLHRLRAKVCPGELQRMRRQDARRSDRRRELADRPRHSRPC
jgi:dipeptidyl aminopeptidase/acylaminoacyl peptidase